MGKNKKVKKDYPKIIVFESGRHSYEAPKIRRDDFGYKISN